MSKVRNEIKKEILRMSDNAEWVKDSLNKLADRAEAFYNRAAEKGLDRKYTHEDLINRVSFHALEENV